MNLFQMLQGSMTTESSVNTLTEKTGASSKQISMLIAIALPILIKMMTKNASSQSGAQSLANALTQHNSKKDMAHQITNADEEDGQKILGHILGGQSSDILSSLSSETGMSQSQVSTALSSMAPALMSGVSAAATHTSGVDLSDGLDLSDVMGMFGGSTGSSSSAGGLGMLGSLLGGGSGGGLLGGLLGGAGAQASGKEDNSQMDGSALLQALSAFMK
ncbi:MAG: DUF937 domain-containing protein [Eubacterium sp.]|nr:DUF937 domain-containing protein [Eubacterium sp.]